MIKVSTILKVSDNSGARFVLCISLPNEAQRLGAFPGMVVRSSIKKVIVKKKLKKSRVLKQGQLCTALIIRTAYGFKR